MATTTTDTFTEEEAKVYDRQIRLWGIQAQQKIRSADVLVVGLAGLATEVVKNLVLAGINSITLLDEKSVTDFDMLSNLFTRNQVGLNRAEAVQKGVQELNPMVSVRINNSSLKDILADFETAKEYIKQFHVVVLVNYDAQSTVQLNQLCNEFNIPFFFAGSWGYYAMVFCDLGKDFNGIDFVPFGEVIDKKTFGSNSKTAKRNRARIAKMKSIFLVYLTLFKFHEKNGKFPEILDEKNRIVLINDLKALENELIQELNANSEDKELANWSSLDGWHTKICGQLTFISSIVGGLLAQDVIRSVTKDNIESNFFFFDGLQGHNLNIGF